MTDKIKIAIADGHLEMLKALKYLLKSAGFEVVIDSNNGLDLIRQIKDSSVIPDVCILDDHLPIVDGRKTVKEIKIRWPAIQNIGFTMNRSSGEEMVKNGAATFLLKTSTPEMICDTIRNLVSIE